MMFDKEDYIKKEIRLLGEKDYDCIYCFCDIDTIPLETFYDVESIPETENVQGNLVWIAKPEYDTPYYIYVNKTWLPAILTSDEELFARVNAEVREHKINEIIN